MTFNKRKLQNIGLITGCLLLFLSLSTLISTQLYNSYCQEKMQQQTETILSLIPEPKASVLTYQPDTDMPALTLDKTDFISILEFPKQNRKFPINAKWEKTYATPCRYAGSIYDGSLVIGGTNQNGQFDFIKTVCVNDKVLCTNMTGTQYSYTITDITYRKHADNDTIYESNDDLIIFVKNMYAFEYIFIRCNTTDSNDEVKP